MAEPVVVVRPITHADIPRVMEIHVAIAEEGRWIGRETPVPVDEVTQLFSDSVDDPAKVHVVAEFDGLVVGHAGANDDGYGHAGLYMGLEAGHRGQGLGGRLLDAVVDWSRARPQVHKVTLQVWPHNAAAIALYRSRGFIVEGHLHKHWRRKDGDLWDAVVMGLLLDP